MKLLILAHEATRTGAPMVLLHLLRWLKAHTRVELHILLRRGGDLVEAYQALGTVEIVEHSNSKLRLLDRGLKEVLGTKVSLGGARANRLIKKLRQQHFDLVYGNTIIAAEMLEDLQLDLPSVLHIHELNFVIDNYSKVEVVEQQLLKAQRVIAVSQLVRNNLLQRFGLEDRKVVLIHEFIPAQPEKPTQTVLEAIPEDAFVVGGCGTIDWRKGIDLFIQVAKETFQLMPNAPLYFVWLGGPLDSQNHYKAVYDLKKWGIADRVIFAGKHPNPQDYFNRYDLFLMTSREDPFPLVCLENAQAGNPILCFKDAVGSEEFINDQTGGVVPYLDTKAMANKVVEYYNTPEKLKAAGLTIKEAVKAYTLEESGKKILKLMEDVVQETKG